MGGYYSDATFVGWVFDHWMSFPTENEYYEYVKENDIYDKS